MLRRLKQTWKYHIGWRRFLRRAARDPDWLFRAAAPPGAADAWIAAGYIAQHDDMPYTIDEVFPVVQAYGATRARQACVYARARGTDPMTAAQHLFGKETQE